MSEKNRKKNKKNQSEFFKKKKFFLHFGDSNVGIFLFPHKKYTIARQDTDCERETVTFNSSFIEFMLAFLGVDQSECACDDPCPSVAKFVKFYIYRAYVCYAIRDFLIEFCVIVNHWF